MGTRMLQRRGTTTEWSASNPVLGDGELGYNRTTGEIRIGDGVTAWNALPSSKIYIPKSTLDTLYSPIGAIPASLVDAAGDLLVGSADNTVVRLSMGANGQVLSVVAGTLTWVYPYSIVNAAGDLLVGTADNSVGRLAKGSNGNVLTIDGTGNVVWAAPSGTTDNTKVLKTGDDMTGDLKMRSAKGLRLSPGAGDVGTDPYLYGAAGKVHLKQGSGAGAYADFQAARVDGSSVYDNGNRVYSASNPPPAAGMTILGALSDGTTPNANQSYAAVAFTAPSTGRVKATLQSKSVIVDTQNTWLSIDSSTFVVAHKWVGTGSANGGTNASQAVIGFTGLTPGGSYTMYVKSTVASLGYGLVVEG